MRKGNLTRGGGREGRRNAWHHLDRDAPFTEKNDFFPAPAKDKGISALEPHHAQPSTRGFKEPRVYLGLACRPETSALAHENELGRRSAKNLFTDKGVKEDD